MQLYKVDNWLLSQLILTVLKGSFVLEQQFLKEYELGRQKVAEGAPRQFHRPIHMMTVAGLLLVPQKVTRKGKGSGYDIMHSF